MGFAGSRQLRAALVIVSLLLAMLLFAYVSGWALRTGWWAVAVVCTAEVLLILRLLSLLYGGMKEKYPSLSPGAFSLQLLGVTFGGLVGVFVVWLWA